VAFGKEVLDSLVAFADGGDDLAGLAADVEEAVRYRRRFRLTGRGGGFVCGAKAAVVGSDRLLDGLRQVAPQVPHISDLDGLRCCLSGRFRVGRGAIPADDLHLGMVGEPACHGFCLPSRQHVNRSAGLKIDQQRGVGVSLEQGELIDAKDADLARIVQPRSPQQAQHRVLGHRYPEPAGKP
jgi:hypothetical protein